MEWNLLASLVVSRNIRATIRLWFALWDEYIYIYIHTRINPLNREFYMGVEPNSDMTIFKSLYLIFSLCSVIYILHRYWFDWTKFTDVYQSVLPILCQSIKTLCDLSNHGNRTDTAFNLTFFK